MEVVVGTLWEDVPSGWACAIELPDILFNASGCKETEEEPVEPISESGPPTMTSLLLWLCC